MNINYCYLIKKMYLSIYVIFIFGVLTLAGCSAAPNFHIQSNQYKKSSLDYLRDDTHCLKQARIASNRYLGRRDFQIIRERIYVKCMANQGNVVLLKDDASEEAIAWVKDEEVKRQKAEEEERERALAKQKAEEEERERALAKQKAEEEERERLEVAQRDTANLAKYTSLLENIVRDDSEGWFSNKYDQGSMRDINFLSISPKGDRMILTGNYKYNKGENGSVEAHFINGKISCLKYWDMRECRAPNDPAKIRAARAEMKKILEKSNSPTVKNKATQKNLPCQNSCRDAEAQCNSSNNLNDFLVGVTGTEETRGYGLAINDNCSYQMQLCLESCR